jgi:hypothetical protein
MIGLGRKFARKILAQSRKITLPGPAAVLTTETTDAAMIGAVTIGAATTGGAGGAVDGLPVADPASADPALVDQALVDPNLSFKIFSAADKKCSSKSSRKASAPRDRL